jgi:hypothetical protein
VLTSSALYKQAIHFPHRREYRIDVTDIDGVPLATDLRVNSASVDANLTNRVTRTASVTVDDTLFPRLPTDPLSPYQAVVRIRAGITYPNGLSELFPLFVGRVYTVNRPGNGSVVLECDDLASDVIAYRLEQPWVRTSPLSIVGEVENLILDALPQATFGTNDVTDAPTPDLVWDEDRGKALDDLANALGGRWYTLGDGSFVLRLFTYDVGTPVQDIFDGQTATGEQGLLSNATVSITRDGTANSVTVISERMDGTDPVRVNARDVDPSSPTLFGGRFGRVSQVIKVQTPQTAAQAQVFARAQLNAAKALTEQWSIQCVPDHTLEPGDTVRASYRGYSSVQLIDSISYPVADTGSLMTLSTRAFSVPDITT